MSKQKMDPLFVRRIKHQYEGIKLDLDTLLQTQKDTGADLSNVIDYTRGLLRHLEEQYPHILPKRPEGSQQPYTGLSEDMERQMDEWSKKYLKELESGHKGYPLWMTFYPWNRGSV